MRRSYHGVGAAEIANGQVKSRGQEKLLFVLTLIL